MPIRYLKIILVLFVGLTGARFSDLTAIRPSAVARLRAVRRQIIPRGRGYGWGVEVLMTPDVALKEAA